MIEEEEKLSYNDDNNNNAKLLEEKLIAMESTQQRQWQRKYVAAVVAAKQAFEEPMKNVNRTEALAKEMQRIVVEEFRVTIVLQRPSISRWIIMIIMMSLPLLLR